MKIKDAYLKGKKILEDNLVEDSDIKARLLICFVLGGRKEELILKLEDELEEKSEKIFFECIDKVKQGMPVQYITNKQEFMGLNFFVNENVLIPQPDTEILVEETMKIAKSGFKLLDLCTGSGAIAIALCKNLKDKDIDMYASDISGGALEVARKNAESNNVEINFIQSDVFKQINENSFDIIVSNPPYIENDVIESLSNEVKHEPFIALAGGDDGLDFYRRIAKEARGHLKDDGFLCLEIGYTQKGSVSNILEQNGYKEIKCIKDLGNNDRVIICKK